MSRPALEVADIFRDHGPAWRQANAGHVSLGQLKVMSAIESCRTAALGGHVERCEDCAHTAHRLQQLPQPALPEVPGRGGQAMARRAPGRPAAGAVLPRGVHAAGADRRHRLSEQGRDLRPPVQGIGRDADHHRRRPQAPRRTHRHHRRAPQLGLGDDPSSARPHDRAGRRHRASTASAGSPAGRASSSPCACSRGCSAGCSWPCSSPATRLAASTSSASTPISLAPKPSPPIWRRCARSNGSSIPSAPFGGPEAVLAYLSRYTHRVAISNRRLIAADRKGVTFKVKDYRIEGPGRYKTMTLATGEFIRRFLIHVMPKGLHRIRHYGLFASAGRTENIARARELLTAPKPQINPADVDTRDEPSTPAHPCPCCGGRMIIIETFERGCSPRYRPAPPAPCSGSTPHDDNGSVATPNCRSCLPLVLGRSHRRSPKPRTSGRSPSSIFADQSPKQPRGPTSPPRQTCRQHSATRLAHLHHPVRGRQISIGLAVASQLPAISSLGGFRTPAISPSSPHPASSAGIRKPSQHRKYCELRVRGRSACSRGC